MLVASRIRRFLPVILLVTYSHAIQPYAAHAQEHPAIERGLAFDKLFQFTGLDQVSYFNGTLSLSIPIGGEYPLSERLGYGLTLTYGSKIWEFDESAGGPGNPAVRSIPRPLDNAGMGWRVSLGQLLDPDHVSNNTQLSQYVSPDGGMRGFYDRLHSGDPVTAGVFYTVDSSYLRMKEVGGGDRTVEFPSGEVHTFGADGRIREIADGYDSFVHVTYPNVNTWRLTDQFGRVQTIRFQNAVSDGTPVKIIDGIDLTAFDGETATYDFSYTSRVIHPACTDTFRDPTTVTTSVPQLDSITLPDGTSYGFTYFATDSCGEGVLKSVTLPSGGKIEYTYKRWLLPTEGCSEEYESHWAHDSLGIWTRTFHDAGGTNLGRWTYTQQLSDSPSSPTGNCNGSNNVDPEQLSTTTVSLPSGDKTRYYFSVWPNLLPASGTSDNFHGEEYGLPINKLEPDPLDSTRHLSVEYLDCAANGTDCEVVRSQYVGYDWEQPCLQTDLQCQDSNRRVASDRTVYHDDSDRYTTIDRSDFDGVGNYRTVVSGGNFPGPGARTGFTNFNPGHDLILIDNIIQPGYIMLDSMEPWVLGKFPDRLTTEGGRTLKSQVCFAENGFLLRERISKEARRARMM